MYAGGNNEDDKEQEEEEEKARGEEFPRIADGHIYDGVAQRYDVVGPGTAAE